MPEARINVKFQVTDEQAGALAGNVADVQKMVESLVLNASSLSVTTLLVHADTYTLSAGTLLINLSTILDMFGVAQNLDTAVVYACAVKALGANNINIEEDVTNGYGLFPLDPGLDIKANGGWMVQYAPAGFGTVNATTAMELLATGTGAQQFQMILVAGIA